MPRRPVHPLHIPCMPALKKGRFYSGRKIQSRVGQVGAGHCPRRPAAPPLSRTPVGAPLPASWWRWSQHPCPGTIGLSPSTWTWHLSPVTSDGVRFAPAKVSVLCVETITAIATESEAQAEGPPPSGSSQGKVAAARQDWRSTAESPAFSCQTASSVKTKRWCWRPELWTGCQEAKKPARSIPDAGWRMSRTLLESKAKAR